jgi:hypothetical protein
LKADALRVLLFAKQFTMLKISNKTANIKKQMPVVKSKTAIVSDAKRKIM